MSPRIPCLIALAAITACGPSVGSGDDTPGGHDATPPVCPRCTDDLTGVIDCAGNVTPCAADLACGNGVCQDPCQAAEDTNSSVGCDYYTVDMDAATGPPQDACYTVFVANVSRAPVHMQVQWGATPVDLARWARLPVGQGQSLTYAPYDPVAGLAPGQVAILFLAYAPGLGNVACPAAIGGAAIGTEAQLSGTGRGTAFHLTTDQPVVAYQMLPYGGGAAAATGASLLLPTSAWGLNYVAVSAQDDPAPPIPIPFSTGPSHNVVAMQDGTVVTIRPRSDIAAGGGLPAGTAGQPWTVTLDKGQYAQISQLAPLSGSAISADKPIGVFGGHTIMSIDRCCGDHGEQMLAPVRALGSSYVAAPHAARKPSGADPRLYRIYGAVDGTQLTYDPPGLGPATVAQGQLVEIRTDQPFVVESQGPDNPFAMFTYMTGAGEQGEGGWGDPDFVRLVPPAQYLSHYVFFTDPTYPFTALTVVRQKKDGAFASVTLDCLGPVTGWQPVGGSGEFEIAYVKLVDHWAGQNGCNTGVRTMDSSAPFGVWVWGWGSEDTQTGWVSYGYPAGENVHLINDIVVD